MEINKIQDQNDYVIVQHKAGSRNAQNVKKFKTICKLCNVCIGYRFKRDLEQPCCSCGVKKSYYNGRKINHNKYSYRIRKLINNKYVYVKSTYESFYVDFLTKNNINFDYEPKRFRFKNGSTYCPDFYIRSCNEYVETKGFLRSGDKLKLLLMSIEYPEIKITVLSRKELKRLGFKEGEYLQKMKNRQSTRKCRNE